MHHQMTYGTTTIEYTLIRKPDKKNVSISVDMYEGVRVIAPDCIEQAQIDQIMYNKAPWILKKQYGFREIEEQVSHHEFLSGEKIRYLGRSYRLKVTKQPIHTATLKFKNGKFSADIPVHYNQEQQTVELKHLCIDWYKTYGTVKIQERIKQYSKLMSLTPTSLLLKDQEKRWGSCTQKGELLINWRIMMAPLRIVDYVVVHEMAHLKVPDHSETFWSFLRSVMPDYEERKEWLRVNGPLLTL